MTQKQVKKSTLMTMNAQGYYPLRTVMKQILRAYVMDVNMSTNVAFNLKFCGIDDVFNEIWNNGNESVSVRCRRYDLIYGKGKNCVEIKKMIPHEKYLLFEVSGSLSRKLTATRCFLAKNARDARAQYKWLYGWDASTCRLIPPSDEAECILTDRTKMPL